MKPTTALLIFSALLFIIILSLPSNPKTEKEPPEINYITKAQSASRMFIKDYNSEIKIPFISNETGKLISNIEGQIENYIYVSLQGGYFELKGTKYYYESIIGIETGNRSATYGVSGIDIIYFQILEY